MAHRNRWFSNLKDGFLIGSPGVFPLTLDFYSGFMGFYSDSIWDIVMGYTQPGYDIHRASHGFSMALIEIDDFPS